MGFYIEDLPTEFNGITMQEADYLADEFLSETPCNRMWDAMRALRDFYETVINEAVEIAEQTEPKQGTDCTQVDWKDRMWAEAVKDEPQTERSE